jgi:hypothetical protein
MFEIVRTDTEYLDVTLLSPTLIINSVLLIPCNPPQLFSRLTIKSKVIKFAGGCVSATQLCYLLFRSGS